jgi:hypothetical protein
VDERLKAPKYNKPNRLLSNSFSARYFTLVQPT